MSKEIFRKKAVEKLTAPEDLHKFIKVANPGVWVLILAIICFLTGVLVWSFVGRLEIKLDSFSNVPSNSLIYAITYVRFNDKDKIKEGQIVRIKNVEYTLNGRMEGNPRMLEDVIKDTIQRRQIETQLGWKGEDLVVGFQCDHRKESTTEYGYFVSTVITASVPPMTYIFN